MCECHAAHQPWMAVLLLYRAKAVGIDDCLDFGAIIAVIVRHSAHCAILQGIVWVGNGSDGGYGDEVLGV